MTDLQVECDFSRIARRWGKKWSQIDHKMTKQNQRRRRLVERRLKHETKEPEQVKDPANPTEEELAAWSKHAKQRDRLMDEEIKLEAENQALEAERDSLIAQVLVSVPREWLIEGAPEDIDWKNPDNLYDFVLESRYNDLFFGVVRARLDEAKN